MPRVEKADVYELLALQRELGLQIDDILSVAGPGRVNEGETRLQRWRKLRILQVSVGAELARVIGELKDAEEAKWNAERY